VLANSPLDEVSVVIPCYNGAAFLAEAIESCFAEGVFGRRLIVVDDGSTDATPDLLAGYGARLRAYRVPNGGPSRARNTGLALVETGYVVFLDADDTYEGGFLSGLAEALTDTGADLALGPMQVIALNGALLRRNQPPIMSDPDTFATAWLGGHTVGVHAQMWRTEALRAIGGFNAQLRTLEEIEHVARAVLAGARVVTSDKGAASYIDRGNTDRVRYGNSEAVITSAVTAWEALEALIGNRPEVRRALGRQYYSQARSAFRQGHVALGRRALRRARACRFQGHHGTRRHQMLCALLGLEWKEFLVRPWK
jgi:glycosyltransferase involved in cell wall biosynthesis